MNTVVHAMVPMLALLMATLPSIAFADGSSVAANPQPEVTVSRNVVSYTGLLNRTGLERLRTQLAAHPVVDVLRIDSSGGDPLAAMEAGRLARSRNLQVVVDGRCNSACANYLFVPAERRVVRPGALVLWHNSCPQNIPPDVKFSDVLAGRHPSIAGQAIATGERNRGKTVEDLLADPRELRRLDRRMQDYFADWAKARHAFFSDVPVDARIVCLGDSLALPLGPGQAYALSIDDMRAFGLCAIEAAPDYLDEVVATLAREGKAGLARPVRLADHPDFQPSPPAGACAAPTATTGTTDAGLP